MTFRDTASDHRLEIDVQDLPLPGTGELRGHFIDASTIAWPRDLAPSPTTRSFELYGSPAGGLRLEDGEVVGGAKLGDLTVDPAGLTDAQLHDRGHLRGFTALHPAKGSPILDRATLEKALTGQLLLVQRGPDGKPEAASGFQLPGVLDALYGHAASARRDLGVRFQGNRPSLALWAPTAASVSLQLFRDEAGTGKPETVSMARQKDGTWTVTGHPQWRNRAYRYDIEVYTPAKDAVEHHLVTDPNSVGLTVNSTHSVLVDLDDPAWKPREWRTTPAPTVPRFAQQTIYELHVRDFSLSDRTVPAPLRGTYAAFAQPHSAGMTHLRKLADAGMTTVHLLPTFDIATIPERRADQKTPQIPADAGPASEAQQAAVTAVADQDAFNWGYDPFHYSTPEGSYASPGPQSGGARTAEFRAMVGGLHRAGLQVVLDQVFNHTASSGDAPTSVLDQVVPGYYQRLSLTGAVENSTCCSNVATEHAMAQKLMVDSVVTWARDYHVDGFRFDLMGHHSRENMVAVRRALDGLTLKKDGVNGKAVYLYGEGWNFGEVADNARFQQATQGQLGGTSIGAFNDRIRDAVHGGGPFDEDKSAGQGFGTGEYTDPNGRSTDSREAQKADLLHRTDLVRLALAGNLADYRFETSDGHLTAGRDLDYNGQRAGFATRPEESVNYVDAHDNETLFDTLVWKLPEGTSMDDRIRMNTLSLATVALGQSPSFWHAGTDLLRSKSMDRDSYNSGDHFNRLDWSGRTNGFGVGLPPAEKNRDDWPRLRPWLADPALKPTPAQIARSGDVSADLLRLRSSSPLFTLGDAALIRKKVSFPNAGLDATPGLLVMRIDDTKGPDADPSREGIVVVFNASPKPITEAIDGMAGRSLRLSSIQAKGAEPVVKKAMFRCGTVMVPARTVAVFEQPQAKKR